MRNVLLFMLIGSIGAAGQTLTFDREPPAPAPRGWTVAMTHEGGPPKWEIVSDPSAPSKPNVIAQTSTDNTSGRFPLAIYDGITLANGWVTVQFKTISGQRDQAAGIVWRYQNPDNYYIVRANALEDNVVLYKVDAGKLAVLGQPGEQGEDEPRGARTRGASAAGTSTRKIPGLADASVRSMNGSRSTLTRT